MREPTKPERAYLIGATALSTFTLLIVIIILPSAFVYVQEKNSKLYRYVEECQSETNTLWREVTKWDQRQNKRAKRWIGTSCCTCQQGPAGAPGRQGKPGAPGAPGPDGHLGRNGKPGVYISAEFIAAEPCQKCPQALVGPPGLDGLKGELGPQGTAGEPGTPGTPGKKGPCGSPGQQGEPGPLGPPGPAGDPGRVVIGAPPGPTGPPGPLGPRGKVGNTGIDGYSGNPGPKGHPGAIGERGGVGLPGKPGPPGTVGFAGIKGGCSHCKPPNEELPGHGVEITKESYGQYAQPPVQATTANPVTVPIRVYGSKTVTKTMYIQRHRRPRT